MQNFGSSSLAFYWALSSCILLATGLHNVTINDNNPDIVYVGSWSNTSNSASSYMNDHHFTQINGSQATFNFTGTAIYYIMRLFPRSTWPEGVSTLISLDGSDPVWINLTSAATENYAVRWKALGLAYIPHTVTVRCGLNNAGQNGTWGEVDSFTYTVPDVEPIPSDSSPPSSASSTTPSSSSSLQPTSSSIMQPSTSPLDSSTSLSVSFSGTMSSTNPPLTRSSSEASSISSPPRVSSAPSSSSFPSPSSTPAPASSSSDSIPLSRSLSESSSLSPPSTIPAFPTIPNSEPAISSLSTFSSSVSSSVSASSVISAPPRDSTSQSSSSISSPLPPSSPTSLASSTPTVVPSPSTFASPLPISSPSSSPSDSLSPDLSSASSSVTSSTTSLSLTSVAPPATTPSIPPSTPTSPSSTAALPVSPSSGAPPSQSLAISTSPSAVLSVSASEPLSRSTSSGTDPSSNVMTTSLDSPVLSTSDTELSTSLPRVSSSLSQVSSAMPGVTEQSSLLSLVPSTAASSTAGPISVQPSHQLVPQPQLSSSTPGFPLQDPSSSFSAHVTPFPMPIAGSITLPPLAKDTALATHYSQSPADSTGGAMSNASNASTSPIDDVLSSETRLSPSQKGGIAGGSITAGGLLVTLVVIAAVNSTHLGYVIASLASALFGLVLFNCRRIIFVCEDPNLPELQISLFLTIDVAYAPENPSKESDGNRHLVWKFQAFSVGGNTKDFDVTVPTTTGRSKRAGQPKIGFGTIDDNDFDERVRPQSWELAPARLLEDGTWERGNEEGNQEDQFIAENTTERACRIAMGISDKPDDPESMSFSPFLVVNSKNFGAKGNFKVKSDIFLHAFRTGGCRAGDYGDLVMEARKLDRLTPEGGRRVKDLDPVTTFYVKCAGKKGEVELQIGKNRPEDVKRFREEHGIKFKFFKRDKAKKKEEDHTALLA